jgi:predicted HTH domain antitoxin
MEIVIPDDVITAMKLPKGEVERELRVDLAVILYQRGVLPLGKAAKLAGMTKREFLEELAKRKVPRHYTERELEEDLAFARGK